MSEILKRTADAILAGAVNFWIYHTNVDGERFWEIHELLGNIKDFLLYSYDTFREKAISHGQYPSHPKLIEELQVPLNMTMDWREAVSEGVKDGERILALLSELEAANIDTGVTDLAASTADELQDFIEYKLKKNLGGPEMENSAQLQLAKSIIKAVTDSDPVGKVRKSGGALYRKTQAGWEKIGHGPLPKKQNEAERLVYSGVDDRVIAGLSNNEVKKALEAVKYLIRISKARYEEGHISHRRGGDFQKKGGQWVKVPTGDRQGQTGWEPPTDKPQMRPGPEDQSLVPPPNPVEDKMNSRSLGSMASHGNQKLVMDKAQQIKDLIKSDGIDNAVESIRESFENAGAGDLFDENMPLDQLAEIAARENIDLAYDEGILEEGGDDTTGNWGSDKSFEELEASNNLGIDLDEAIAKYTEMTGEEDVDAASAYDSALVDAIKEGKISADEAVFANGRNRAWLDEVEDEEEDLSFNEVEEAAKDMKDLVYDPAFSDGYDVWFDNVVEGFQERIGRELTEEEIDYIGENLVTEAEDDEDEEFDDEGEEEEEVEEEEFTDGNLPNYDKYFNGPMKNEYETWGDEDRQVFDEYVSENISGGMSVSDAIEGAWTSMFDDEDGEDEVDKSVMKDLSSGDGAGESVVSPLAPSVSKDWGRTNSRP